MMETYLSGIVGGDIKDIKSNYVSDDIIGDLGDRMFHGELKDVQRDQDTYFRHIARIGAKQEKVSDDRSKSHFVKVLEREEEKYIIQDDDQKEKKKNTNINNQNNTRQIWDNYISVKKDIKPDFLDKLTEMESFIQRATNKDVDYQYKKFRAFRLNFNHFCKHIKRKKKQKKIDPYTLQKLDKLGEEGNKILEMEQEYDRQSIINRYDLHRKKQKKKQFVSVQELLVMRNFSIQKLQELPPVDVKTEKPRGNKKKLHDLIYEEFYTDKREDGEYMEYLKDMEFDDRIEIGMSLGAQNNYQGINGFGQKELDINYHLHLAPLARKAIIPAQIDVSPISSMYEYHAERGISKDTYLWSIFGLMPLKKIFTPQALNDSLEEILSENSEEEVSSSEGSMGSGENKGELDRLNQGDSTLEYYEREVVEGEIELNTSEEIDIKREALVLDDALTRSNNVKKKHKNSGGSLGGISMGRKQQHHSHHSNHSEEGPIREHKSSSTPSRGKRGKSKKKKSNRNVVGIERTVTAPPEIPKNYDLELSSIRELGLMDNKALGLIDNIKNIKNPQLTSSQITTPKDSYIYIDEKMEHSGYTLNKKERDIVDILSNTERILHNGRGIGANSMNSMNSMNRINRINSINKIGIKETTSPHSTVSDEYLGGEIRRRVEENIGKIIGLLHLGMGEGKGIGDLGEGKGIGDLGEGKSIGDLGEGKSIGDLGDLGNQGDVIAPNILYKVAELAKAYTKGRVLETMLRYVLMEYRKTLQRKNNEISTEREYVEVENKFRKHLPALLGMLEGCGKDEYAEYPLCHMVRGRESGGIYKGSSPEGDARSRRGQEEVLLGNRKTTYRGKQPSLKLNKGRKQGGTPISNVNNPNTVHVDPTITYMRHGWGTARDKGERKKKGEKGEKGEGEKGRSSRKKEEERWGSDRWGSGKKGSGSPLPGEKKKHIVYKGRSTGQILGLRGSRPKFSAHPSTRNFPPLREVQSVTGDYWIGGGGIDMDEGEEGWVDATKTGGLLYTHAPHH